MDDYTQTKSTGAGTLGVVLAGSVAVLVLLYALFGTGTGTVPVDPASIGTTDEGAPAVQDTSPIAPAAPAEGE